jgi:hypothetical protein
METVSAGRAAWTPSRRHRQRGPGSADTVNAHAVFVVAVPMVAVALILNLTTLQALGADSVGDINCFARR